MKPIRQSGRDLFHIALAVIALGIFNLAVQRYIDGTLCILAGISVLLIWNIKRRK